MRTRFFQAVANPTTRNSNFMISRSYREKSTLPILELSELIFLGIFGIAALRSISKEEGEKKRVIKPDP